ncbi:pleckstrin homology domain-containing family M member 1 [Ascaphus truei]|uniref:pleckstrin homology domain-containing family M member 1 n=1 Tax=Ascaphus truei TaxID=8439 RepID=UPI003F599622
MFSADTAENDPVTRETKQRIKKTLASSLKALQISHVATDRLVTSEDDDANTLCVALEAVFVHGLRAKFIKTEPERRNGRKKGRRAPLPQPAFWALLKTITHRNVIAELENLAYINTDVGRCRAWLRLALNDCLMECYFISLQREKSRLRDHYQPCALLLDIEDCDVVLSYLQGLSSLSFSLSYKSSVLNEWTVTPLSVSGFCPWPADVERLTLAHCEPRRKKSWDSASQSSSSDDTNSSALRADGDGKGEGGSSSPSLDTNSSFSQLSSSIGSDGQLQAGVAKCPDRAECSENSPSDCDAGVAHTEQSNRLPDDLDTSPAEDIEVALRPQPDSPPFYRRNPESQPDQRATRGRQSPATPGLPTAHSTEPPPGNPFTRVPDQSSSPPGTPEIQADCGSPSEHPPACDAGSSSQAHPKSEQGGRLGPASPPATPDLPQVRKAVSRGAYTLLGTKSRSWISDEDVHRPAVGQPGGRTSPSPPCHESGAPSSELEINGSGQEQLTKSFNVIHRRQIGLSNPFRGLLMLGNLERRNAMGMYKCFYCELSPYEFRLFLNAEDRICLENCSLLRCESLGRAHSDGRFDLQFTARKLHLRAPSEGEAQDWVDRLREALQKCRPPQDEAWEFLEPPASPEAVPETRTGSPIKDSSASMESMAATEVFDWVSLLEAEPDALKESILYMNINKTWSRFIFSLSETALTCFSANGKVLYNAYNMETVRDILPDSGLGGPSCFRVVTSKGSLQLRAENPQEAKTWRELVRASYLESAEDTLKFGPWDGSLRTKSRVKDNPFFQHLLEIPTERGLDSQNFKCAGCPKLIGFHFGKAKLCAFSGLYYCEGCHENEDSVIPSRMVHNWDLRKRAVSRPALKFMNMVRNEPLIDVKSVNESLYGHVQRMSVIGKSRERLKLLGDYLLTCRSGALRELSKSLDHRSYLLESAHTYSVLDLKQIADGAFEGFLESLMQFASSHVYDCDLCSQRGFICQICNQDDIIYPFQFDTTTRCAECKAVFHSPCKSKVASCPRCLRRKKYRK